MNEPEDEIPLAFRRGRRGPQDEIPPAFRPQSSPPSRRPWYVTFPWNLILLPVLIPILLIALPVMACVKSGLSAVLVAGIAEIVRIEVAHHHWHWSPLWCNVIGIVTAEVGWAIVCWLGRDS
jgi:hypothetical protein